MPARSTEARFLTGAEATARLGIKPATLYTYVSRGWIRRIVDGSGRRSRYHAEDVERIRARGAARGSAGTLAAGAIRYGEPIVPTSITEITPEGPRYRNRLATEMARSGTTFEAVAELLWTGVMPSAARLWRPDPLPAAFRMAMRGTPSAAESPDIHRLLSMATLALGRARPNSAGAGGEPMTDGRDAMQLIVALTGCFGVLAPGRTYRPPAAATRIAVALAHSLAAGQSTGTLRLLDAALVLAADHELNPATFVARIAASSDVDLHACVAAAICTDSGARIARACDDLEEALRSVARGAKRGSPRLDARSARPTDPGFDHPLYPHGDPRGATLLELIAVHAPAGTRRARVLAYLDAAANEQGLHPRFEMSLAALSITLRLPPRSVAGIYTLGRVAGWVAHISEQRLAGYLIRPRAKFTG